MAVPLTIGLLTVMPGGVVSNEKKSWVKVCSRLPAASTRPCPSRSVTPLMLSR